MKVIVDTSVWSLALRRGKQSASAPAQELKNLIHDHRVQMIGPIELIPKGTSNIESAWGGANFELKTNIQYRTPNHATTSFRNPLVLHLE